MYKLRVYLTVPYLQPQFVAWLGSPLRARGYPPKAGDHSLFIEIEPALAIHKITDVAIKTSPELEIGLLYTERQFGLLEVHHADNEKIEEAGSNILNLLGAKQKDQTPPQILYSEIITDISDQHAIILNRMRHASMLLPDESLMVVEVSPALFAGLATNEALKVSNITLIHAEVIGATGRIFLSGSFEQLKKAQNQIDYVLKWDS